MKNITRKIISNFWIIKYILPTIYFNFHYLPFAQAIKLPILLYKPKFLACKGKIIISGGVKTGMIKLGSNRVALYPNNGICFENRGVIVFQGNCTIGMNSFISIAPSGKVVFGDGFVASNSLKLASYCNIEFGKNVRVGWECLFTDTDFHRITMLDGSKSPTAYGQILIGDNCWFGFKNIIMKNTRIPNKCIISANSLVNKN